MFYVCSECYQSAFTVCSECYQSVFGVSSKCAQSVFDVCSGCYRSVFRLCSVALWLCMSSSLKQSLHACQWNWNMVTLIARGEVASAEKLTI